MLLQEITGRFMTGKPVVGASPVTFISEDTGGSGAGVQYQVPLSALLIAANGTVDRSGWTHPAGVSATDLTNLDAILANLLARGVISPAPP